MNAMVKDPADAKAIALVSAKDPSWNATLRTTCVATMLDGGHATNALPQRARANINCRIFPGVTEAAVREQLEKLVADPSVKVTMLEVRAPASPPPPLSPTDHGAAREAQRAVFSRRSRAARPAGRRHRRRVPECASGFRPTASLPLFVGPDLGNIHGLNEYVGVQSLLDARAFLYDLVKVYSTQK